MHEIEEQKPKKEEKKSELVSVTPLKDFVIHQNEFHYELKKGESIEVHKKFLQNLITEEVIKKRGNK